MKYQDFVPFYQKLNYKCKSGTVDDSNRCSDNIPAKNNTLLDSIIQNKIEQVLERWFPSEYAEIIDI